MSTPESILGTITTILGNPKNARSNDVRDWPANEAAAHRNFEGDFTDRNAAVAKLRNAKIAADILEAVTPLIRAQAWTDAADRLENSAMGIHTPENRLRIYAENEFRALALRQLPDTKRIPNELREMLGKRLLAGDAPVSEDLDND